MLSMKMKSTNKVLQAVTGVIFVVGLKYFADDETIVKCLLIKDNKSVCYLEFLSNTLKSHVCESYNVIVDVSKVRYDIVNSDKTSSSRENWNDILKTVLNHYSFDSIVKVLELNTGKKHYPCC